MRVDDIESKVIEVLMLEEDDKTVREISNATNVKQNALRKCLDMMLKKGTLSRNKVGQSWRWRINQASEPTPEATPISTPDVREVDTPLPTNPDAFHSTSPHYDVQSLVSELKYKDMIIDSLLCRIEDLKGSVEFLREEARSRNSVIQSLIERENTAEPQVSAPQIKDNFITPRKLSKKKSLPSQPPITLHNKFDCLDIEDDDSESDVNADRQVTNLISPSSSLGETFAGLQNLSRIISDSHQLLENPPMVKEQAPPSYVKAEPRKKSKPSILITGDSMLKGVNAHDLRNSIPGVTAHVTPNHGALVEELDEKMAPDIRRHDPDLVIIHAGINDCRHNSEAMFSALNHYEYLLNKLLASDIIPIVSLPFSVRNYKHFSLLHLFNQHLINICKKLSVNFFFNDNINGNVIYFNRGGHLNYLGSNVYSTNLSKFMNFLLPQIFINNPIYTVCPPN